MRRKIMHLKRYKSYPKNVPRKLLKLFFGLDCSVSKLAASLKINSGTISALLNDGKEPKDSSTRAKLFLSVHPVCKTCGRRIVQRSTKAKREQSSYLKAWKKLPTKERQKAIEQYILWRKNNVESK